MEWAQLLLPDWSAILWWYMLNKDSNPFLSLTMFFDDWQQNKCSWTFHKKASTRTDENFSCANDFASVMVSYMVSVQNLWYHSLEFSKVWSSIISVHVHRIMDLSWIMQIYLYTDTLVNTVKNWTVNRRMTHVSQNGALRHLIRSQKCTGTGKKYMWESCVQKRLCLRSRLIWGKEQQLLLDPIPTANRHTETKSRPQLHLQTSMNRTWHSKTHLSRTEHEFKLTAQVISVSIINEKIKKIKAQQ